jgi:hypothetical protein
VHHVVNRTRVVQARLGAPERLPATEQFFIGLKKSPILSVPIRYPFEHVFRSEGPPHRQDRPAHDPGPATALLRPAALRRGRLGLGDRLQPSPSGVALPPGGQLLGSLPGAHGHELRGAVPAVRRGGPEELLHRILHCAHRCHRDLVGARNIAARGGGSTRAPARVTHRRAGRPPARRDRRRHLFDVRRSCPAPGRPGRPGSRSQGEHLGAASVASGVVHAVDTAPCEDRSDPPRTRVGSNAGVH